MKQNLVIVGKKGEKRNMEEITYNTFEEQLMIVVLKLKVFSISRYYQERYQTKDEVLKGK